ncbi:MAG: LysR family transcriptional regulator [Ruminococcaceae bacterium]|nr:LysR family transcriptional regulator [Oscillospiraceae bacterium]
MLDTFSKYVYEVYRCKSVSLAAKKLFISQPALSASIKKAESELGAPIFNRSTLPFSLTPEGKIYIKAIESIMQIEKSAKEDILDISELKSGSLTVGTATNVSFYVIPMICETFRKKYPRIDVNIVFSSTEKLPSLLEKKTVDLIFTSSEISSEDTLTEPLFVEKCIVAVRSDHPEAAHLSDYALSYRQVIDRSYPKEKEISDLSLLDNLEFIYSAPGSNLYKKRKLFFGDSEVSPHVTSSTSMFQLNYNLMRAGFGALFTTDCDIATTESTDSCLFFAIDSPSATQNFSIIHSAKKDSSSFRTVNEFIATAKELFCGTDPLSVLTRFNK